MVPPGGSQRCTLSHELYLVGPSASGRVALEPLGHTCDGGHFVHPGRTERHRVPMNHGLASGLVAVLRYVPFVCS